MKDFLKILIVAIVATSVMVAISVAISVLLNKQLVTSCATILFGIGSITFVSSLGIKDKYVIPVVSISAYCWMQSLLIMGLY